MHPIKSQCEVEVHLFSGKSQGETLPETFSERPVLDTYVHFEQPKCKPVYMDQCIDIELIVCAYYLSDYMHSQSFPHI